MTSLFTVTIGGVTTQSPTNSLVADHDATVTDPHIHQLILSALNDTPTPPPPSDARSSPGVYVNGIWRTNTASRFGGPGQLPVVGDWDGIGDSEIGTYANGVWRLDYNGNGRYDGPVIDRAFRFGGADGRPVAGYWKPNAALLATPPRREAFADAAVVAWLDRETRGRRRA